MMCANVNRYAPIRAAFGEQGELSPELCTRFQKEPTKQITKN